jgi:hypothetical protein
MKFWKLLGLMFTVTLLGTGCGGIQKQLDTVLVFEHSVQGYVQQLTLAASAAIVTLPADQRQVYQAQFDDLSGKLSDALSAKERALQAAIAADSWSGIDIGKLTQAVVDAVEAFVVLVTTIGNDAAKVKAKAAATDILEHQARVKAVMAQ